MNMETELISDLLKIVISYLPELDQHRVRFVIDEKIKSGSKPVPVCFYDYEEKFYDLFPEEKGYKYQHKKAEQLSVKHTINSDFAHLKYPDCHIKKISIKSETLKTLIIDADIIEKVIIKAPGLVNLVIYGFGNNEQTPVIRLPSSVKMLVLHMFQQCDYRLNKKMIQPYKTSESLNIREFYTSFQFFENDYDMDEDEEFIKYINPEILWLASEVEYNPELLTKVLKYSKKLKMIIAQFPDLVS